MWSLGYLGVVALSAIPVLAGAGKFTGIYFVVTTLPWSLIFGMPLALLDGWLRLQMFEGQIVGATMLSLCALINAVIIYRVAAKRRPYPRSESAQHDA
jgi:hypothetical protein